MTDWCRGNVCVSETSVCVGSLMVEQFDIFQQTDGGSIPTSTLHFTVTPCSIQRVRGFIEAHHYSGSVNGCKVTQCYALHNDGALAGAILFGALSTTAWKKYALSEGDVVELRRMCLLDGCPPNTATFFMRHALAHLKRNYQFEVCVSYADPYHGHHGGVYQAGNWKYAGQTAGDVLLKTPEGKLFHSRAMRTKHARVNSGHPDMFGDVGGEELKPFAKRLQELNDNGELQQVTVPGKHIYLFPLNGGGDLVSGEYPKPANDSQTSVL